MGRHAKLIAVSAFVLALLVAPVSLAAPPEGSDPVVTSRPRRVCRRRRSATSPRASSSTPQRKRRRSRDRQGRDRRRRRRRIQRQRHQLRAPRSARQVCSAWVALKPSSLGREDDAAGQLQGRPANRLRSLRQLRRAAADLLASELRLRAAAGPRNAQQLPPGDQQRRSHRAAQQLRHQRRLGLLLDRQRRLLQSPLEPGQTCTLEVNFNPQDASPTRPNCEGSPTATASPPRSAAKAAARSSKRPRTRPTSAPSRSARIGAARTITLTNSGNIPAGFFIGIVAGGDSGSFQLLDENCTGAELMPAASCTAQVRFRPQAAGPKAAHLAFFGDSEGGRP